MEEGETHSEKEELINAPSKFKSSIWSYFRFFKKEGKKDIDMTHVICKDCRTKVKYSRNTTNMRAHLSRYHPAALAGDGQMKPALAKNQPTLDTLSLVKLPSHSEHARKITQSIVYFMVKDLCPFSVVENAGFCNMLKTLEPRYVIPSRHFFADNAVPKLYQGVKLKVKESL